MLCKMILSDDLESCQLGIELLKIELSNIKFPFQDLYQIDPSTRFVYLQHIRNQLFPDLVYSYAQNTFVNV